MYQSVLQRSVLVPERSQGQEVWSLEEASGELDSAMLTEKVSPL
jgi:hypothetical protein